MGNGGNRNGHEPILHRDAAPYRRALGFHSRSPAVMGKSDYVERRRKIETDHSCRCIATRKKWKVELKLFSPIIM
jgi:hypothetical protein